METSTANSAVNIDQHHHPLSQFRLVPNENPAEIWLDLQGTAPAPVRDHHQLIVRANDQITWRTWRISNANKHGMETPNEATFTFAQYKDEDRLQDDINRVFGADIVSYIQDLINGKVDYLQRLPAEILLNIAQFLYLEDLFNLSLSSQKLGQFWDSPDLWEYYYKKYSSEPVTRVTVEIAKRIGWKDLFLTSGNEFINKLRAHESRALLVDVPSFSSDNPEQVTETFHGSTFHMKTWRMDHVRYAVHDGFNMASDIELRQDSLSLWQSGIRTDSGGVVGVDLSKMESLSMFQSTVSLDSKESNQLLNMKVLRLLKPSLLAHNLSLDGNFHSGIRNLEEMKPVDLHISDDLFHLSEEMVLPLSFGTMFLGQHLYCYACVSNVSNIVITDIIVRLEFQVQAAASPRSEIVLNEGKQFSLDPQQTFDFVINREIRDLGSHMMIASITYSSPQNPNDRLNVKKCFRYTVSRPMDFKNKFVSLPDGGYFGEFNVQNLTHSAIVLENVRMITSAEYSAEELATNNELTQSPLELLQKRNFLGPNDSRQFVFRIHLTDKRRTGDILKSNISPGRIEILWRSRMGDLGKVPDFRDIFVTLSERPARVKLHTAFAVTVGVFSLCNKAMDLIVKFMESPSEKSFVWCGISGRSVGALIPGGMLEFKLSVVPCSMGLHLFPRFYLIDKLSGQRYDSDDLAEIFIE